MLGDGFPRLVRLLSQDAISGAKRAFPGERRDSYSDHGTVNTRR